MLTGASEQEVSGHGSELGDFTRMLVSAAAAVVAAVAATGSPAADRAMAPA